MIHTEPNDFDDTILSFDNPINLPKGKLVGKFDENEQNSFYDSAIQFSGRSLNQIGSIDSMSNYS